MDKQTRAARRAFKKHVADFSEVSINGLKMWVLNWKAPNTNAMAVRYICSNSVLMVSGDLGESTYVWHGNYLHLQDMQRFGLHYFLGKLTASSFKKYAYDPDKAAKDLTASFRGSGWFKSDGFNREEAKELLDEVISIYSEYDDPELAFVVAQDKTELSEISDLCECRLYDCGKTTDYWIVCHYVGLQMAIEQLQKRGILPL